MVMIFYVAAGGAAGAAGRHLINVWAMRLIGPGFPWGTLCVNVLGSFAMGCLITYMALKWSASQEMRAFLTTGILGGFTTFSAFSLDFATLFERKQYFLSLLYMCGSVGLSLAAIFSGMFLIRAMIT